MCVGDWEFRRCALPIFADHADVFDKDAAKQFSATTFILPDGTVFVAFRGTDATLAGWKEDFMLAFSEIIPSQDAARAYLEQAVARYEGPVVVGGHSKGGNLAVYAAICRTHTFL